MAKAKLTDRSVQALKAKDGKQTEYFDKQNRNFSIRVSPKGKKVWYAFYRVGRRLRRHFIGTYPNTGLADARSAARSIMNQAEAGKDPAQERKIRKDAQTFEQLANEFIEKYSEVKKRSAREDARIVKINLIPVIGDTLAKDVTRRQVREMIEDIAEGRLPEQEGKPAPVMANRVLALTRKIFNWAIAKDVLELNPCYKLQAPGTEGSRDRVLSDDEIAAVWTAINTEALPMASLYKLRLITAQRGGEVASMKWKDLDFESKMWTIPSEASKNGKLHRVPLSDLALKKLLAVKSAAEIQAKKPHRGEKEARGMSEWVFPARRRGGQSTAELQKAVQRIRTAANVDFRAHDLRRTAASKMTELGVPRLIVKKILNHADSEITAVYDRFAYDREKREALDRWAKRLTVITSGLKIASVH
jgi:integrase